MKTITKLRFKQVIAILMVAKAERLSLYYNTKCKDTGICNYMGNIIYEFTDNALEADVEIEDASVYHIMKNSMLDRAFKSWDIYSGDKIFPVPSMDALIDAEEKYQECDYLWTDDGYGNLRRELAAHCVISFNATLTRINQRIASYEK